MSRSAAPPPLRHVPRVQRRLRPPHHHLLARGPPLPSRWVSGPGDAAAELPRHGPGLPAGQGHSGLGKPRRARCPGEGGNVALLVADESGFPPCPVPRCGEKPAGSQEQLRARRVGVGPGKGILAEKGKAPGQGGSPAVSLPRGGASCRFLVFYFRCL